MSHDTTLLLAATGKTGRRIAARLRLRGTPVRAASRPTPLGTGVGRPTAVELRSELRRGPLPRPAGRRGTGAPSRRGPRAVIDIEDVADAAATVLTEPGRHAGRVYELSGPRALTFSEAVELISRASGRPLTYRQISPDEYARTLVDEGFGEDDARHVAEMFVLMERGLIAATTDDLATVLGRAPRTFEEYVVRAAAAGAWRR